eukprot:TRINITY_DN610_c2_g1_i2.p1 TRINITY_DN610_c2_g1~~TRINITY_DN610_c2_g1_i2.p1  ORF type:complete len:935 (-),score=136.50 TRINITY_DN610_c2_g1_i2:2458-5220(-)
MNHWIDPKPLNLFRYHNDYVKIDENDFFSLMERKSSSLLNLFPTSEDYVIVMKNEERWVVSTNGNKKNAQNTWKLVLQECEPLGRESDVREQMISFLESKFKELPLMPSEELQSSKLKKQVEDQDFMKKQFNLPSEIVITTFLCTYEGVLKAGKMYLSNNYMCFTAKMVPHDVILPFKKIKGIEKSGSFTIVVKTEKKDFEFNFMQRDEVYVVITELWNLVMDRVLHKAESVMKSLEGNTKRQKKRYGDSPQEKYLKKLRQRSLHNVQDLTEVVENKDFQRIFRLTKSEYIEQSVNDCIFSRTSSEIIKGTLFISVNVFGFYASDIKPFWVVIPYQYAEIELNKSDLTWLIITTKSLQFALKFPPGLTAQTHKQTLLELWEIVVNNDTEPNNEEIEGITMKPVLERIIQLYPTTYSDYQSFQEESTKRWIEFNERRPFGRVLLRDEDMIKLARQGFPDGCRGEMWKLLSGSLHSQNILKEDYYDNLLKKNKDKPSMATDEIEKDITRSFPNHQYYQSEEGQRRLRDVLIAYSWHNEAVGYCQSMNIITALLLLFMEESDAFFILSCICETLMPNYYNRAMLGSMVDVNLFGDLIAQELPHVYKKLSKLSVPIPAVTMPWFLCLYIGYVPIHIALRILDAFFCEGYDVLFRVGLAIVKLKEDDIMRLDDTYSIMVLLKRETNSADEILKLAFEDFGSVSIDTVKANSYKHKAEAVKVLDDSARINKIGVLRGQTKFSKSELEDIYTWVQSSTDSFVLHRDQIRMTVTQFCPYWLCILDKNNGEEETFSNCIWRYLANAGPSDEKVHQTKDHDIITFDSLVYGLSPLLKGSLYEKIEVCVNIASPERNSYSFDEVSYGISLALTMYQSQVSEDGIKDFVKVVFDKFKVNYKDRMSLSITKEEIFEKPIFIEYFDLDLSSNNL